MAEFLYNYDICIQIDEIYEAYSDHRRNAFLGRWEALLLYFSILLLPT